MHLSLSPIFQKSIWKGVLVDLSVCMRHKLCKSNRVNTTPIPTCSVSVELLATSSDNEFRVCAENAVGVGQTSQSDKASDTDRGLLLPAMRATLVLGIQVTHGAILIFCLVGAIHCTVLDEIWRPGIDLLFTVHTDQDESWHGSIQRGSSLSYATVSPDGVQWWIQEPSNYKIWPKSQLVHVFSVQVRAAVHVNQG